MAEDHQAYHNSGLSSSRPQYSSDGYERSGSDATSEQIYSDSNRHQWCSGSGHTYPAAPSHVGGEQRQLDFTADPTSELSYGSFHEPGRYHVITQQQQYAYPPPPPCPPPHVAYPFPPQHGDTNSSFHASHSVPGAVAEHKPPPLHNQPFHSHERESDVSWRSNEEKNTQSLPAVQGDDYYSHAPPGAVESQSVTVLPQENLTDSTAEEYQGSFMSKVQKFVVKHAEVFNLLTQDTASTTLFDTPTLYNHASHSEESYKYAEPDALEYQMQVDTVLRKRRFLELVAAGDIMRGHIAHKTHGELLVNITSFIGSSKSRELTDIDIKGVLPLENLSSSVEKCDEIMRDMQLNDVIQALVVCQQEQGTLLLSCREDHVEQLCPGGKLPEGIRLGYLEGKKPIAQRMGLVKVEDYLHQLEDDPGFANPRCTDNLKTVLGIEVTGTKTLEPGMRPTLFKDIQMAEYPETDYCHALRKAQRNKWSMNTVALGVKHIKSGSHIKALELLDHALQIDPENVEALVARGALYANGGKYMKGIADFEKALTIKHTHKNARRYLVETQVAYGETLEKEGKLQQAMRCYREALADDPEEETAKERLGLLTASLEKQAAERKEQERKKADEKEKLKQLYKIIEEEKEKKIKKFNKKIKQSMRRRKKPSKSTSKKHKKRSSTSSRSKATRKASHRHKYSSSSSELDDSDDSTLSASSSDHSRSSRSRKRLRSRSRSRSKSRSRSRSKSRSRSHSPARKGKKSVSRSPKRSRSRSHSPEHKGKNVKSSSTHSRVKSRSRSRSNSPRDGKSKSKKKTHRYSHSRSRSRSPSKKSRKPTSKSQK